MKAARSHAAIVIAALSWLAGLLIEANIRLTNPAEHFGRVAR
jgi:hypothetical protein